MKCEKKIHDKKSDFVEMYENWVEIKSGNVSQFFIFCVCGKEKQN